MPQGTALVEPIAKALAIAHRAELETALRLLRARGD
jgi:hypothetical protein